MCQSHRAQGASRAFAHHQTQPTHLSSAFSRWACVLGMAESVCEWGGREKGGELASAGGARKATSLSPMNKKLTSQRGRQQHGGARHHVGVGSDVEDHWGEVCVWESGCVEKKGGKAVKSELRAVRFSLPRLSGHPSLTAPSSLFSLQATSMKVKVYNKNTSLCFVQSPRLPKQRRQVVSLAVTLLCLLLVHRRRHARRRHHDPTLPCGRRGGGKGGHSAFITLHNRHVGV